MITSEACKRPMNMLYPSNEYAGGERKFETYEEYSLVLGSPLSYKQHYWSEGNWNSKCMLKKDEFSSDFDARGTACLDK